MRIATPIGLAAAAVLVGASLAAASATTVRPIMHTQITTRGHVDLSKFHAVPGRANAFIGHAIYHPIVNGPDKKKKGGCIYLSDNLSGTVTLYSNVTPWGPTGTTLTSTSLYGWGVAANHLKKKKAVVFVGTYSDTIDEYKPCSSKKLTATLTGSGSGSDYPYGMDVSSNNTLYATVWPSNNVDYWLNATGTVNVGTDTNQYETYFVDADKSAANVYLSGYNSALTQETVDKCSATITGCATVASVAGGFPGGVQIDAAGNLYVNNQYGTLYAYNGCPSACAANGSFTYSNGTNPLDYTQIVLDTTAANLWGANIYYCSSSYGLCGDGQSQSLPITGSALNGATSPGLNNSEPLGIEYYKPDSV